MNEVDTIKSKSDIERMKAALHGRDLTLFILGVSLGLRISDLLTLRVGDVRGQSYVKIREGKTNKWRRIDFSKSVLTEAARLHGADDDYIFRSRKGVNKPISRVQAYRILNGAAERAGLEIAIGTHTLRKTHGYMLYDNGVDLSRIMTMLNHSSEAMTAKYIGITKDEIADAYRALEV